MPVQGRERAQAHAQYQHRWYLASEERLKVKFGTACPKCGGQRDAPRQKLCRSCEAAKANKRYKISPEKNHAAVNRWRKRYPERYKRSMTNSNLKKKYGITLEQYEQLLETQGGVCKICGNADGDSNGRKLFVDHNHKTGAIRGLLCTNCNFLIGHSKEQPSILKKAAAYLKEQSHLR